MDKQDVDVAGGAEALDLVASVVTLRVPVAAKAKPKTADDVLLDEFGLQATRLGAIRGPKGQG
jgi:hypothetical protein